jgi:hypothetical protein
VYNAVVNEAVEDPVNGHAIDLSVDLRIDHILTHRRARIFEDAPDKLLALGIPLIHGKG